MKGSLDWSVVCARCVRAPHCPVAVCRYPLSPMSPSDRDIQTAANEVIKSHDDPLLHVASRYDALMKRDDLAGCRGVAADCEDSRRGRSETFFDVRCLWASWLGDLD